MTLRLGLLGHPVGHSLSPRIHRAFGAQQGTTVDYPLIDVDDSGLADAMRELHQSGAQGANITVPHKTAAPAHCVELAAGARDTEAVNTLVRAENGWRGENTDGRGLVADLKRVDWSPAGRSILIIGAGGAARGAIPALLEAGARSIGVYNRTLARASELAARFAAARVHAVDPEHYEPSTFELALNATSAGHQGRLAVAQDFAAAAGMLCYDMNYGPAAEPLRRWARDRGLAYRDGLGMLVAQAAESYRLWTGFRPRIEPVIESLR